jgi:hypothetical protein
LAARQQGNLANREEIESRVVWIDFERAEFLPSRSILSVLSQTENGSFGHLKRMEGNTDGL